MDFNFSEFAQTKGAFADVQAALIGPTDKQAGELIAMLSVACIKRAESDVTNAITLALYSDQLRQFPADVARYACVEWAKKNKWFPALAEIIELAERLAAPRRAMARELKSLSTLLIADS